MPDEVARDEVAFALGGIARRAGGAILDLMRTGVTRRLKPDGSPCTDADLAAEALIVAALKRRWPDVPIVAEESAGTSDSMHGSRFFLVDPLDGTRDFIAGTGAFTVNIALVDDGAPVAGAIYAPAAKRLWIGGAVASTTQAEPDGPVPADAWRALRVRPAPVDGLVALASLRHGDAESERFMQCLPIGERKNASSSLKFCAIAAGEADVYVRFGRTMQWDTAAGDAIVRAAGGAVTDPFGKPLAYGGSALGFANGPFVAWGDADLVRRFRLPPKC